MADSSRHGPYVCHSDNRNHSHASIVFKTNGTSNPTAANNSDPHGLISPDTVITRSALGTIVVTLRKTYDKIHAVAGCGGTAGARATVSATTTNSVTISTFDDADAATAGDLNAATDITVILELYGNKTA